MSTRDLFFLHACEKCSGSPVPPSSRYISAPRAGTAPHTRAGIAAARARTCAHHAGRIPRMEDKKDSRSYHWRRHPLYRTVSHGENKRVPGSSRGPQCQARRPPARHRHRHALVGEEQKLRRNSHRLRSRLRPPARVRIPLFSLWDLTEFWPPNRFFPTIGSRGTRRLNH